MYAWYWWFEDFDQVCRLLADRLTRVRDIQAVSGQSEGCVWSLLA